MDFYSEYFDAYQGSKNQAWLVNCALLNLISGNYESAKKLSPENAENPFFWALCNFDAEDYGNSIFYSDIALSSNKHIDLKLDSYLTSILSDCYVFLSDYDSAEVVRENFIDRIQNSSSYDYPELPVILTNSAVWNFDKENYESAFDLILLTLNIFFLRFLFMQIFRIKLMFQKPKVFSSVNLGITEWLLLRWKNTIIGLKFRLVMLFFA